MMNEMTSAPVANPSDSIEVTSRQWPAQDLVRDRYAPYRASEGKRILFETADFRELRAPYDHGKIAMIGFMSEAQARESLAILVRAHEESRMPKVAERIQILQRAALKIESRAEAFADLIAWEGGKPLRDARVEVARAVQSLKLSAEEAGRLAGHEIPMGATPAGEGHWAFTTRGPIGVVFAISAFNHPLNLIAHQVGPAIASGCPVLIKPSVETPLSCLHLLDALFEAGLPAECCLPLICDNETAEVIAKSPQIQFMSFIGSARVGWHLRSVLAPGVRLSLEHGGTAPVIVDQGCDLARTVNLITKGGFYHAGQVCVSTQRIFVHEEIKDEFLIRLEKSVRALKTGQPRHESTDCGPIIRERDLERIEAWVSEAVKSGARLVCGGRRVEAAVSSDSKEGARTLFEPTILDDVDDSLEVMASEIFGPVVCVNSFRDVNRAIHCANRNPWAFQAAVFTKDLDRALKFARGLKGSAVMINESTAYRVDSMPFRGDGPSGFGTGGIPYTVREMSPEKMICMKWQESD